MAAVLIAAAALTVGAPDWGTARQFLFAFPSRPGALAAAAAFTWAVVLAVVTVVLIDAARVVTRRASASTPLARGVLVLVVGVMMLTVGYLHHLGGQYSMCCGNTAGQLEEAVQLAH